MERMNCEIIRDLMPSYLDKICSDATRQCVEEHIAVCVDCKKTLELLQNTALSATQAENRMIDAVKKFKRNLRLRSFVSFGLLCLMFAAIIVISGYNYGIVPVTVYVVALPVFLTATFFLGSHPPKKGRRIERILSTVILVCGIFLMYYSFLCVRGGQNPFGFEAAKVGIVLDGCLLALIFLQGILYVSLLIRSFQTGNRETILCGSIVTGIFLLLSYHSLLKNFNDIAEFGTNLNQMTGLLLGIGVFTTLLFLWIEKRDIFR